MHRCRRGRFTKPGLFSFLTNSPPPCLTPCSGYHCDSDNILRCSMRRLFHRSLLVALAFGSASVAPAIFTRPAIAQPAPAADYAPLEMDELEQLAAPVALYPDAVLAQVLVA